MWQTDCVVGQFLDFLEKILICGSNFLNENKIISVVSSSWLIWHHHGSSKNEFWSTLGLRLFIGLSLGYEQLVSPFIDSSNFDFLANYWRNAMVLFGREHASPRPETSEPWTKAYISHDLRQNVWHYNNKGFSSSARKISQSNHVG